MSRFSLSFLVTLLVAGLLASSAVTVAAGAVTSGSSSAATASAAKKKSKKCKKGYKKVRSKNNKVWCKKVKKKPAPVVTPPTGGQPLVGTFKITAGQYLGDHKTTGSYFRMIQPGGSVKSGPYFPNGSSAAADSTFTLLNPGTDGGLITGEYQEPPDPAFSSTGYALAKRIITPTKFVGVEFSVSTSPTDPQTATKVVAPSITESGGKLGGDLRSFSAEWNNLYFNQGSPKPNGTTPGLTTPVTGTYNETTKAFIVEWASTIVGGPFNSFSGYWHLEGTFVPKPTATTPPPPLGGLLQPPF